MSNPAIDIEKLSSEERLRLIEDLWESLRTRPDAMPLTRAQRDELDRRLDELDRGETETVPWEEVNRRLRNRPERLDLGFGQRPRPMSRRRTSGTKRSGRA